MWCFGKEYKSNKRHDDKVALVTGANSGLGFETAKELYNTGAYVILLCRNEKLANEAIDKIKTTSSSNENPNKIKFKKLDLSDLTSIRKCAKELLEELNEIHILVNNAGVIFPAENQTKQGFEIHMGINYFGPFLFTLLLLPGMMKTSESRIVNVSSLSEKFPFLGGELQIEDLNFRQKKIHPFRMYAQSKVALTIFTKELARRLKENGVGNVTTYSVDPGLIIATHIGKTVDGQNFVIRFIWNYLREMLFFTSAQGASTTLYCALDEAVAKQSGLHYRSWKETSSHSITYDEKLARRLWDLSVENVKLKTNPFFECSNNINNK